MTNIKKAILILEELAIFVGDQEIIYSKGIDDLIEQIEQAIALLKNK